MAKKTKKQTRKAPSTRPTQPAAVSSSAPTPPAASTQVSTITSGRGYEVEFRPDYSETIKDLKRIGILAGSFFMVLIVLSFFLR